MREPPCAALARERRQLESEESNAHADIVELKTIVAHLERLRLELTREQAFELRTCEKIRSSERTLARQTQKVLNHLQITYPIKNLYGDSTCTVLSLELPIDLSTLDDEHVCLPKSWYHHYHTGIIRFGIHMPYSAIAVRARLQRFTVAGS